MSCINRSTRLNKYISQSGVCSRRAADELIKSGRVRVNNDVVSQLGVMVNPQTDTVTLDGKTLGAGADFIYIMLNKPIGCVTTVKDQFGRRTVMDYIRDIDTRVFPVGRLDYNTSGLLFLTNDGEFAKLLTHPSHKIKKTYIARVNPKPTDDAVERLRRGVVLSGGDNILTRPAAVKILNSGENSQYATLEITITQGLNRQVRKMCEAVGLNVMSLHRTKIGGVALGKLPPCAYRLLPKDEAMKAAGVIDKKSNPL